jgi:hypothetical protein
MSTFGKYEGIEEIRLRPGEPVFVLRAQDALAPYAVSAYAQLLRAAAAGAYAHDGETASRLRLQAREVEQRAAAMIAWQAANHVKLPD